MSEIKTQEKLVEIASRVKGKGDTWDVNDVKEVQKSLTDALEAYFMIAEIKPKSFRLDLADGKLYAIFPQEVEVEVKKYSIYGDYIYE
jgi:hypothetical protein